MNEIYVSVRKLDGGFVLDTSDSIGSSTTKVYTSLPKLLAEIKRVLAEPNLE